MWPDGRPLGRGHGQPYLQSKYADRVKAGTKTWEGRVYAGWCTKVREDDWITFKVSGSATGETLIVRALKVQRFVSFEAMLREVGLEKLLPGCTSIHDGVELYRSFRCFGGTTYGQAETTCGVVAIEIVPVDFMGARVGSPGK